MLPRHARCVLSRLRCNRHSLALNSYLPRIGRIESYSCSGSSDPTQETSHLSLHCPATDSLHRTLFGHSFSLYFWPRPWGATQLLGLHGLPACLHSLEKVGKQQYETSIIKSQRSKVYTTEFQTDQQPSRLF